MYVMDEESEPLTETTVIDDNLILETASEFVFYTDKSNNNRKILVGVNSKNALQNNYYDGPFDQLADNYIKDDTLAKDIQLAYPDTQGRIDKYGVFTDIPEARVAIQSYFYYESVEQLTSLVKWCQTNATAFYACITSDYKQFQVGDNNRDEMILNPDTILPFPIHFPKVSSFPPEHLSGISSFPQPHFPRITFSPPPHFPRITFSPPPHFFRITYIHFPPLSPIHFPPLSPIHNKIASVITPWDEQIDDQTFSPPQIPDYYAGGLIDWAYNAKGQQLTDLTVGPNGMISNGVLVGTLTNQGRVSNLTLESNSRLTGGIVTGYIDNHGEMADFEFRGAEIVGGTLAGEVINTSQVGGYFRDVQLAAGAHLRGGQLAGEISGDAQIPALLEDLEIQANSYLEYVMIGEEVKLATDITWGEGVQFLNPDEDPRLRFQ